MANAAADGLLDAFGGSYSGCVCLASSVIFFCTICAQRFGLYDYVFDVCLSFVCFLFETIFIIVVLHVVFHNFDIVFDSVINAT